MVSRKLSVIAGFVLCIGCAPKPGAEEARRFLKDAESQLYRLSHEAGQAQWIQANFITQDSEAVAAKASQRLIDATVAFAKKAATFDGVELPPEEARKLKLLKTALTLATPADPAESEELTRLVAGLEGGYGRMKYCPGGDTSKCLDVNQVTRIMATSRNAAELLDVWRGWHDAAAPMRKDYTRFVELANKGARELGFADSGAMWRSKYDMPPDEFAREVDRLWEQVKPLYVSLHTYVRSRLREKYGAHVVPENGPIPAHLLGNIWAQQWDNLADLTAPKGAAALYDLTAILARKKIDEMEMVRIGERFFTSLGFEPLPSTFWERSLFVKPRDREVVCHASAWDVDNENDLRIKMCIQVNAEDFTVIHHELGHNFYQRAYNKQPMLFRDSANDGFHEAIGDTIALSITPEYLVKTGFLDKPSDPSADTALLLSRALDKVAFLPFGLTIDQWRWKVFNGEINPAQYNSSWWEMRRKYQGVAPTVERTETHFDPGAKYHVPANVPYTRYFLAHILQFQFHRALAKAAGCAGPLHRCSIYGSKEAGARLQSMLAMGLSKPWPEALKAMTGEERIDATALLDYFAPLKKWLDEQNAGQPAGW